MSGLQSKWWLWAILVLVILGAIGILVDDPQINGVSSNRDGTQPQQGDESKSDEPKPVASVAARNLMRTYRENSIRADRLYKGKLIEVSGQVDTVGRDLLNSPYVTLKTGSSILMVQCFFEDDSPLASLSPGQPIRIQGRCDGKFGNVLLKECTIVR